VSASQYLEAITRILSAIELTQMEQIREAARVVADSLMSGGRIWMAKTTHCLHSEAHHRAGGLMAVHMLDEAATVSHIDCVIAGSPVGTHETTVDLALDIKKRDASLIAITNVAFEGHEDTVRSHASGSTLHEIADVVIDAAGPIGDGVFELPESGVRVIPHSGSVGAVVMWMVFAEAISLMRAEGESPLMYQCIAVAGADEFNSAAWSQYCVSSKGFVSVPGGLPQMTPSPF